MIIEALGKLVVNCSLSFEEAAQVMTEIMSGAATPAQFAAFVTALRIKGESVDEIAGMASVMAAMATPVAVSGEVVDTCGTGGDGSSSFNISTTAAFVVAGAGLKVAKHGNRAMSSQCGSADVLEALGVNINLGAHSVAQCIEKAGIGFMFAPVFHPAMKYAATPRREIGIRTIFNILGPLTNPAKAKAQVIGVPSKEIAIKISRVLERLGTRHSLVVYGEDGMDEISITGKSLIWEISEQGVTPPYEIAPEDFGYHRAIKTAISGKTPKQNAATLRCILQGETGPLRDVVVLNSAAALVAGDKVKTLQEGALLAEEIIDNGQAFACLESLVRLSQSLE